MLFTIQLSKTIVIRDVFPDKTALKINFYEFIGCFHFHFQKG